MCLCNLEEGLFSFAAALPETVYFSRGSVAMARLLAVIQRRPAASSIQNARGDRPASVQGELHLQGVTFAYPTRPALPVLKRRAPDTARLCPPVALCFCSAAQHALPCHAGLLVLQPGLVAVPHVVLVKLKDTCPWLCKPTLNPELGEHGRSQSHCVT